MEDIKELKDSFFKLDKKVSEALISINSKFDIIRNDITNRANENKKDIELLQQENKDLKEDNKSIKKELKKEQDESIRIKTTVENFKYLVGFVGFILTCLNFALKYIF